MVDCLTFDLANSVYCAHSYKKDSPHPHRVLDWIQQQLTLEPCAEELLLRNHGELFKSIPCSRASLKKPFVIINIIVT